MRQVTVAVSWVGYLLLVVVGILTIGPEAMRRSDFDGSTLDYFVQNSAQIGPRADDVEQSLKGISAEHDLAFLASGADASTIAAFYLVSYMSWPSQVRFVDCKGADVAQGQGTRLMVLYGRSEPVGTAVLSRPAPRLTVAEKTANQTWEPFCR